MFSQPSTGQVSVTYILPFTIGTPPTPPTVTSVTPNAGQSGDVVTIDVAGEQDGEPLAGLTIDAAALAGKTIAASAGK